MVQLLADAMARRPFRIFVRIPLLANRSLTAWIVQNGKSVKEIALRPIGTIKPHGRSIIKHEAPRTVYFARTSYTTHSFHKSLQHEKPPDDTMTTTHKRKKRDVDLKSTISLPIRPESPIKKKRDKRSRAI